MTVQQSVTPLVDPRANLRKSAILGSAVGVVGIVITSIEGHPLMGLFGCLGIALGALNNRMLQRSVIAYATDGSVTKARFRNGVLGRLMGITIFTLAITLLIRPDGLGVFAGLALFQILMLVGAARPVFRSMRPSS
ncbi:MAG: hypothetical protein QOG80_2223 [Pseudonocardiales bacterium]|jgi:hypothetical protein|nr:hypothetical protein [Pseudonocardiales bacterium]